MNPQLPGQRLHGFRDSLCSRLLGAKKAQQSTNLSILQAIGENHLLQEFTALEHLRLGIDVLIGCCARLSHRFGAILKGWLFAADHNRKMRFVFLQPQPGQGRDHEDTKKSEN